MSAISTTLTLDKKKISFAEDSKPLESPKPIEEEQQVPVEPVPAPDIETLDEPTPEPATEPATEPEMPEQTAEEPAEEENQEPAPAEEKQDPKRTKK